MKNSTHRVGNFKGRRFARMLPGMKLTAVLMMFFSFQVSAKLQEKVTLHVKNASLVSVLKEVRRQTGYLYSIMDEYNDKSLKVSLAVDETPIEEALGLIFKNQPFTYAIIEKTIVVKQKEVAVAPKVSSSLGKDPELPGVEGNVTDENGEPLSGASIKLKNGNVVAITDEKGRFKVKNIGAEATLEFSYTGYAPQKMLVGDQRSFKISLRRATNKLDEVQVVAYGTTTERLNTGNVTKVTSKEIEEQPVSNALAALEGRVAGLVITQTTGLPGGGFTVQIRGKNSIENGTDPFYVIDGVPYNSQLPGNLINVSLNGGNPFNFINPYDIESIEVLKDADATAIYGSRAANGAILITTKKGKAGTMKFDLNVNTGTTTAARDLKTLNTQQYLAMRHEAFKNDGAIPSPDDHDINSDWDTTRYTNWSKTLTGNTARYTDANISVSGGNTNTQYLIGAGYNRQTTGFPKLIPGDGADQKASIHFNINSISPNKKFKLVLTGSYVADKNTVQTEDFTNDRITLPPDAPAIFNPDGSLNWAPLVPGQRGTFSNPYAALYAKYKGTTTNLVSNAVISYTLLRGLDLKTNLGYTNTQTNEIHTLPTTIFDPAQHETSGSSAFNFLNTHSWIIEPQADYKMRAGRGLIVALVGASFHASNNDAKSTQGSGFISDALLEDIQAASSVQARSNSSQYKYQAFFGRLNYDWQDKYLLNLTARRDGTSRFGPGKQFADFGAVGAAWIFTREAFIQQNFTFLSFGKIRASYGSTGNDQVGDYRFIDLYVPTYLPYQGSQGLYPNNLFNSDLAWESTKKLEGAIELGFFKDRVTIQMSLYRNRSNNQLVQTPISQVTGFSSIPSNLPALVQNTGKEFVINSVNVRTKSFTWSSSFNLTIARNKLVSFPNLANSTYSTSLIIGKPITILQLYSYSEVNDTTGLYQFASIHGGNTYSPDYFNDPRAILDLTPKFYGGMQNSILYKGFSFDVFFQFVNQKGRKLFATYSVMPGLMLNQPVAVLNRWQQPGDKKPFQQLSQSYGNAYSAYSYMQQSDYAYGDASFIRLKNLAFSWQLPQRLKRKMELENFRIYVQGQNLFTITKYQGFDPENQGFGTGPRRVWTAGIQLTL